MKRFFLGSFFEQPASGVAMDERVAACLAGCLSGAPVRRTVLNHPRQGGPRGDGFAFDFVAEAWIDEPPGELDPVAARKAAIAAGVDPARSYTVLAREHIIKEGKGAVKGTFLSKRRPDSTVDEYLRYWRKEHADIIQAQTDFFSHVRRYVQNHFVPGSYVRLDGAAPAAGEAFDGSPQMWFDDPEAIHAAFATQGYLRHIKDDEKILVKVGYSQSCISGEREISLPAPMR